MRDAPRVGPRQRLDMVRLAISENPRFDLDPAEVDAAAPSYTVPTLERLRHPDVCGADRPLVLLVGYDAFAGMAAWHRWQCLFDLAHIAIAHRPGYVVDPDRLPAELANAYRQRLCTTAEPLAESPAGRIVSFDMTPLDISATHIRSLLSNNASPRYLMPESVIAHIREHNFYTEN